MIKHEHKNFFRRGIATEIGSNSWVSLDLPIIRTILGVQSVTEASNAVCDDNCKY